MQRVSHCVAHRLGPYDLHESWTKMSGGASPSSALPKKKKKSDAKPQSQINKCLNEKRRREQENIYIEELAELISASFADMSSLSVKPDKCAILQETVKQNRRIKPENSESLVAIESAVQQGEVSSSKQSKISNTELAPLLLSALEGFLLVVSADGRIEFVSDNIEQFLNYNQEELIGESVYNFIHHGDHTRFGLLLNNPLLIYSSSSSIVSPPPPGGSSQSSGSLMEQPPPSGGGNKGGNNWNRKFTTKFNCRLLVKPPPSDRDQTIEEKQSRPCQYKTLQISSTKINGGMLDDEENTDGGGQSLLCIAQHALNEKHLSPPLEQFSFKLDQNGEILSLDTQNVSDTYAQYMKKENLAGRMLHEKCHKSDALKVINHIKETRRAGFSTSPIFRLHLVDDKYINVQTKSKHFNKNEGHDTEFIMATLSIIGDSEMCNMIENHSSALAAASTAVAAVVDPLGAGGTVSLNGVDAALSMMSGGGGGSTTCNQQQQQQSNVQSDSKFSSNNVYGSGGNNRTTTPPTFELNLSNFSLFPGCNYGGGGGDMIENKPWTAAAEQSASAGDASNKTTPVPSPAATTIHSNPPPHTPAAAPQTPYGCFPFSPLVQSPKDTTFDNINNAAAAAAADKAEKLRSLLTTSSTKRADGSFDETAAKHNILKGLLNQNEMNSQDDDSVNHHHHHHHHGTPSSSPANVRQPLHNFSTVMANDTAAAMIPPNSAAAAAAAASSNNNNNMLLKLLNDKSEDEDLEARIGIKKQNELLQQLLKEDDNGGGQQHGGGGGGGGGGGMHEQNEHRRPNDDNNRILKVYRILSPASPDSLGHGSRKRNSVVTAADDDNEHPPLKRTNSSSAAAAGSGATGPLSLDSLSNPSSSIGGGGSCQSQVTTSKLRERNKMLAELLEIKDPTPPSIPVMPASVISGTPQEKLANIIKQQQQQQQQHQQQQQQQQQPQQQQQQQQQPPAGWNNNNQHQMCIAPSQRIQQSQHQNLLQRTMAPKSGSNPYLNTMLDQQPQTAHGPGHLTNMHMQTMRLVTSSATGGLSGYNTQFGNAEINTNLQPFNSDPELSELLEEVMDIMVVTSETAQTPNTTVGPNTVNQSSFNSLMNENMAVSEIKKCLMQVESSVKSPVQLNYGGAPNANSIQVQNQFIPPPAYQPQQKNTRFNHQQSPRLAAAVASSYPKNVQTPPLQQQQLLLQQQQQKQRLIQQQQQQQQQKQRLLQQQQQQKMVVSSNSAAIPNPDPTTALQTIDSLINNSVAPNVALQLSSNVPDSQSQLSPVYAAAPGSQLLNSSQISPSSNRQPPYNNLQQQQQSFSMLNYGTTTQTQTTAQSQQQMTLQTASQMSPSSHPQYQNTLNPCVNQQQYQNQQTAAGVWTQQQRLTLHQQQNPMLNAQLQVAGFNNGGGGGNAIRQNFINPQQQQQQMAAAPPQTQSRVLTSPVGYNTEVTANANCTSQQQQQQQQLQQQQFRVPRSMSITTTPTNAQIPGGGGGGGGGNNGVTEYTRNELRAFVGVRSQQGGGNARMAGQLLAGQNVTAAELDPLGLNFDMSPSGGSESPKWSGLNSDHGTSSSPQPQVMAPRGQLDDAGRLSNANSTTGTSVSDQKSSLLQKLLSE
ncbi:nuclear receptor coactivator 2-like isoform X2 [Daktulosphaira vitifoliae]|uniref:nuclear receptor coactivator 2-like isoform X2 n=1 Tax=Daktulosphaira vitifoliae TaxID=58002 RepID=UPI0021AA6C5B|nr:nuclear receptor coactivator 2-like isoform X2 [Daktulosphaira vitifoliae]